MAPALPGSFFVLRRAVRVAIAFLTKDEMLWPSTRICTRRRDPVGDETDSFLRRAPLIEAPLLFLLDAFAVIFLAVKSIALFPSDELKRLRAGFLIFLANRFLRFF